MRVASRIGPEAISQAHGKRRGGRRGKACRVPAKSRLGRNGIWTSLIDVLHQIISDLSVCQILA